MKSLQQVARQALGLIDLTSLNDTDDETVIRQLCARARGPAGTVAAVCIDPAFVTTASKALAEQGLKGQVKVATVVNFPHGKGSIESVVRETKAAIAAGADEIDVVFPWPALLAGDAHAGRNLVAACRQACSEQILKVILETGQLVEPELIRQATELAIKGGADFVKTSTGKVAVNATLSAAAIVLEAIRESHRDIGFKASGGIRTTAEAAGYLALAEQIMGAAWISPMHFRFGASSLLDDLLRQLDLTSDQADHSFSGTAGY